MTWFRFASISVFLGACHGARTIGSPLKVDEDILKEAIALRHELHATPEIAFDLPISSSILQKFLSKHELTFSTGWGKPPDFYTSVIETADATAGYGLLVDVPLSSRTKTSKGTVLLRADFDGLPVQELSPCEPGDMAVCIPPSTISEQMHACGHDFHAAAVAATIATLKRDANINGSERDINVAALFQPAEEVGIGMETIIAEGLLDERDDWMAALALHVNPYYPVGAIVTRPGTIMAAATTVLVDFVGRGGHAAAPHSTIDPLLAAAQFVTNVQQVVSRNLNPNGSELGVVSVTQFHAGSGAFNVIAPVAKLTISLRALTDESLSFLKKRITQVAEGTAHATGTTANVSFDLHCCRTAATVNDQALYETASKIDNVETLHQSMMWSEDVGILSSYMPTLFSFIGVQSPRLEEAIGLNGGLHDPTFYIENEAEVLRTAVDYYLEMIFLIEEQVKKTNTKVNDEL